MTALLAQAVLALHLVIINFNIIGLIVIPLGGWMNWRWVRVFWWRSLHLALLAIVAIQAALGRACILTLLQDSLTGSSPGGAPLIMRVINRLIFWPLPIWVFAALYAVVLIYAAALWWIVPPRRAQPSA